MQSSLNEPLDYDDLVIKAIRVIDSCETWSQLQTAKRYVYFYKLAGGTELDMIDAEVELRENHILKMNPPF